MWGKRLERQRRRSERKRRGKAKEAKSEEEEEGDEEVEEVEEQWREENGEEGRKKSDGRGGTVEEELCSYLFCCDLRKTLLLIDYASTELISEAHAEGGLSLTSLFS
jgi:hypothetical protein